jgi:GDP-L-fucose synthase
MPTNLYGPNDNYDLNNSHVLPAMIRKFHEAKISNASAVHLWGDGSPLREFLHVDDLAEACLHLMLNYNEKMFVNVGTGTDLSIKELAELVQSTVGYTGSVEWDSSKPNGTPRKLMNVDRIHQSGWKHKIDLKEGVASVYELFKTVNTIAE